MFRSPANPVIRIVFIPILLLFYLQHSGALLPILAPMFVVIFLTLMPSKPPTRLMFKMLIIVFFVSFVLVSLGGLLLDSPTGYALFCWSVFFWSYYRSHQNSKDIFATLMLIVIIIMTIMSKQMSLPIDSLPRLMFQDLVIAIVVTSVAFFIFPGDEQNIQPDEQSTEAVTAHIGLIAFKATAMCLVLAALIGTGSSQATLIAITISSMIKTHLPHEHKTFTQSKLVTTVFGILFTLPVLLLFTISVTSWVVIGVTIFCGIQLACYAIRRKVTMSIYQLLFTNFTVLTYQIIKHQGSESFSAELMRLVSISLAIVIGAIILNLAKPNCE